MAVDLFDLVDPLKRSVQPPGTILFPTATDDEFVGYLSDAFWEIRMLTGATNNLFDKYSEADGSIVTAANVDPSTPNMPREMQQLIVLFAGENIVMQELKNVNTQFRAKAGSVEFETATNGNLLRDILTELARKRTIVERYLFSIGAINDYYIDSVVARTESMIYSSSWYGPWWVN